MNKASHPNDLTKPARNVFNRPEKKVKLTLQDKELPLKK